MLAWRPVAPFCVGINVRWICILPSEGLFVASWLRVFPFSSGRAIEVSFSLSVFDLSLKLSEGLNNYCVYLCYKSLKVMLNLELIFDLIVYWNEFRWQVHTGDTNGAALSPPFHFPAALFALQGQWPLCMELIFMLSQCVSVGSVTWLQPFLEMLSSPWPFIYRCHCLSA